MSFQLEKTDDHCRFHVHAYASPHFNARRSYSFDKEFMHYTYVRIYLVETNLIELLLKLITIPINSLDNLETDITIKIFQAEHYDLSLDMNCELLNFIIFCNIDSFICRLVHFLTKSDAKCISRQNVDTIVTFSRKFESDESEHVSNSNLQSGSSEQASKGKVQVES